MCPFVGVVGGRGVDHGGTGPARGEAVTLLGRAPPFKSPLDETESNTGRAPALTVNAAVGRVPTHTAAAPAPPPSQGLASRGAPPWARREDDGWETTCPR